jgi:hypothetical protein
LCPREASAFVPDLLRSWECARGMRVWESPARAAIHVGGTRQVCTA